MAKITKEIEVGVTVKATLTDDVARVSGTLRIPYLGSRTAGHTVEMDSLPEHLRDEVVAALKQVKDWVLSNQSLLDIAEAKAYEATNVAINRGES